MTKLIIALTIILLTARCTPSEVDSVSELAAYVRDKDHGLSKSIELRDYTVQVSYRPVDLMVEQQLRNEPATIEEIQQLQNKYNDFYYFVLSISRDGRNGLSGTAQSLEAYGDLVERLSFQMNEYVRLTTDKQDTIPVADFWFNHTLGMSKSSDLLFAFSKSKVINKKWVRFDLEEFGFDLGHQTFQFRLKDIDNTPKLKTRSTPTP